jgi:hypothetical protein
MNACSHDARPGDARAGRTAGVAAAVTMALTAALGLSACGNTLQDQPIGAQTLEQVIVKNDFPVYWAGLSFAGMPLTRASNETSGAVTVDYGDCIVGGQYTCVTPLEIVTSPDNSFVPGGMAKATRFLLRGVRASALQSGRTIALGTGPVVVTVMARDPALARAAAEAMSPLNEAAPPRAALQQPLPDTGAGRIPLASQLPPGAG